MDAKVLPIRLPVEPAARSGMDRLLTMVQADLNAVNTLILDRMQSPVALIPELAGHLIASGGKRLRPMLTLACAKLMDYQGDRHHRFAACVEFIHTATLLHDDVVDSSGMRRGRKTANILWGNQPSVLVGDFLFAQAFELMVEDGSLRALKILSRASAVIAQGEVLQLTTASDLETTEDQYLEVIAAKTAVLFAAACQVAAVVAERPERDEVAVETFGRNLGIAFQLVDDALDFVSEEAVMGKSVGDDFREGKLTLPVILAYQRGTDDDRAFWRRTVGKLQQGEGDLARAISLVSRTNAIADTLGRARHYGTRAKDALAGFPDSRAKTALLDTVDFAIARAF